MTSFRCNRWRSHRKKPQTGVLFWQRITGGNKTKVDDYSYGGSSLEIHSFSLEQKFFFFLKKLLFSFAKSYVGEKRLLSLQGEKVTPPLMLKAAYSGS